MSLITLEVEIDHGTVKPREPHLLPEAGAGLLTILRSEPTPSPPRERAPLPLIHCTPGTIVNPTAEDLDASLWG